MGETGGDIFWNFTGGMDKSTSLWRRLFENTDMPGKGTCGGGGGTYAEDESLS